MTAMKMTSTFKNTIEGDKFWKTLRDIGEKEVSVGFFPEDVYDDGTPISEIAAYNDLGTSHIPARPFMEQAVDGHTSEIERAIEEAYECIVEGDNLETFYHIIGAFLQGLVQKEISSGNFVPNAPATIRKKGSAQPLIDTGRMKQSVRYHIRKRVYR